MDRDDFKGLMDVAISREIEAFDFYTKVAENIDDKGLVQLFSELAEEEKSHRVFLESLLKRPDMHIVISPPGSDFKLAEQTELPALSTSMKPADAIALAMKKEQQAVEYYRDLAERTADDEIKEMCLNLSNMELKHKMKLENAYVDIAYIESF